MDKDEKEMLRLGAELVKLSREMKDIHHAMERMAYGTGARFTDRRQRKLDALQERGRGLVRRSMPLQQRMAAILEARGEDVRQTRAALDTQARELLGETAGV